MEGQLEKPTTGKKKITRQYIFTRFLYLICVLFCAFAMYFFFIYAEFKGYVWLEKISKANENFRVLWAEKVPDSLKTWFSPTVKETSEEKLSEYKLTILSKNLDLYFKNLLIETQEQIANENLLSFIKNSENYYNYYKIKRDLQKYLEHNADILEFSLYDKAGEKLISLKYKDIGDYLINDDIVEHVQQKNNVLLKHKNSENLVLISAVKNNSSLVLLTTQTINPVFFTRILDRLEISDQLFYLKDSDDFVVLDNYEYIEYKKTNDDTAEKNKLAEGFYKSLIQLKEKSITVDFNNIHYSLGTVVERNNIWGNGVALLTFLLILYIVQVIVRYIFRVFLVIRETGSALFRKGDKNKEKRSNEKSIVSPAVSLKTAPIGNAQPGEASQPQPQPNRHHYADNDDAGSFKPLSKEQEYKEQEDKRFKLSGFEAISSPPPLKPSLNPLHSTVNFSNQNRQGGASHGAAHFSRKENPIIPNKVDNSNASITRRLRDEEASFFF